MSADSSPSKNVPGLEAAAGTILKRAVSADNERKYLEALTCYTEGIELLLTVLKTCDDDLKKQKLRSRLDEYITRAEKLKIVIKKEKSAGRYHEQIHIANDSTGNSYEHLFKPLLDEEVTQVQIDDPYIRSHHQVMNCVRFCETLLKHATNLTSITLTTGQDSAGFLACLQSSSDKQTQESALNDLSRSLSKKNIRFEVSFSATLHDREIRFSNGWIVKIGRGLDYFKAVPKYSIGSCDYDLRPCYETTVDIFHRKALSD